MAGFWKKAFGGGSAEVAGEIISSAAASVGKAADGLFTSSEERIKVKDAIIRTLNEMETPIIEAVNVEAEQLTERHKHDMESDNWLSKNTRPGLIWKNSIAFMVLSILSGFEAVNFHLPEYFVYTWGGLIGAQYTYYYGSRGIEKITRIRAGKAQEIQDVLVAVDPKAAKKAKKWKLFGGD